MTTFELFVKRARVDLDSYFLANKISSDEQLKEYCLRNDMQPPEKKYFQNEDTTPVPAKAKIVVEAIEPKLDVPPVKKPSAKPKPKTTKTTKPRTTKQTTRKKS